MCWSRLWSRHKGRLVSSGIGSHTPGFSFGRYLCFGSATFWISDVFKGWIDALLECCGRVLKLGNPSCRSKKEIFSMFWKKNCISVFLSFYNYWSRKSWIRIWSQEKAGILIQWMLMNLDPHHWFCSYWLTISVILRQIWIYCSFCPVSSCQVMELLLVQFRSFLRFILPCHVPVLVLLFSILFLLLSSPSRVALAQGVKGWGGIWEVVLE